MLGDGGVLVSKFQKNIAAGTNTVQLNVGDIKSGTYFIKLINKNGSAGIIFNKQ